MARLTGRISDAVKQQAELGAGGDAADGARRSSAAGADRRCVCVCVIVVSLRMSYLRVIISQSLGGGRVAKNLGFGVKMPACLSIIGVSS